MNSSEQVLVTVTMVTVTMLPFLLRCVRYKCGLINTIQDVLRQRPGWVEVKE